MGRRGLKVERVVRPSRAQVRSQAIPLQHCPWEKTCKPLVVGKIKYISVDSQCGILCSHRINEFDLFVLPWKELQDTLLNFKKESWKTICSSIQHLLNAYLVPRTVLGPGAVLSKQDQIRFPPAEERW